LIAKRPKIIQTIWGEAAINSSAPWSRSDALSAAKPLRGSLLRSRSPLLCGHEKGPQRATRSKVKKLRGPDPTPQFSAGKLDLGCKDIPADRGVNKTVGNADFPNGQYIFEYDLFLSTTFKMWADRAVPFPGDRWALGAPNDLSGECRYSRLALFLRATSRFNFS
jgi:hypothetical protein